MCSNSTVNVGTCRRLIHRACRLPSSAPSPAVTPPDRERTLSYSRCPAYHDGRSLCHRRDQLGRGIVSIKVQTGTPVTRGDLVPHGRKRHGMQMVEYLPALLIAPCRWVEHRVCVTSQQLEIHARGFRRVSAGEGYEPVAQLRRCGRIGAPHYRDEPIRYGCPISLVRGLESRHRYLQPREQLPGSLLYQRCVCVGYSEIVQRALHENRELSEPVSNGRLELARCPDEIEEPGCVHLVSGVIGQSRKLLGGSCGPATTRHIRCSGPSVGVFAISSTNCRKSLRVDSSLATRFGERRTARASTSDGCRPSGRAARTTRSSTGWSGACWNATLTTRLRSPSSLAKSPASRWARYWTATWRSKVTPPPPEA